MIFAYPKGWDGKVRGRFLRYHQKWKGSGKVQPIAGTFLGSVGRDSAAGAKFQASGSIVALVNVADPSAFSSHAIQRLGADPELDKETEVKVGQGKRERVIQLEQRAPMLIQFNDNLSEIRKIIQFPLRTATGMALEIGIDGSVSATLRLRPGNGKTDLIGTLKASEILRDDGKEGMFGTMVVHFDQAEL